MSFLVRLIGRGGSKKRREKEEYINTFYIRLPEHPDLIGDECESEYTLSRAEKSARSCKLKTNTEDFQPSEVYGKFYSNPFYTGEAMGIKGGRAKGRRLAEKKKGEKVNV